MDIRLRKPSETIHKFVYVFKLTHDDEVVHTCY
jgi:hypothetical protein